MQAGPYRIQSFPTTSAYKIYDGSNPGFNGREPSFSLFWAAVV
ncbi:Hypothetical protein Tcol_2407 [Trichococcus collinsii]|uniref:Uncharacterized protein n=1 Tax=Trichococcus collinsii TaxID=157076 RepID=A0AB37ZZK8_9LACT|nr:Hypothetical protein Tcol_2407 [Trichococcus collinsii]SEA32360.1 hypothetical protein SAMN04488525_102595 [Trichococcus collinsii]